MCKPPPFCHWGNRGTPRSGNLLQVTWLVYQGSMMPREDSRMACVVPLVAGTSQGEDAKWSHPRKRHVVGAWRARDTLSSSSPELDNRVGRCPQGSLSGDPECSLEADGATQVQKVPRLVCELRQWARLSRPCVPRCALPCRWHATRAHPLIELIVISGSDYFSGEEVAGRCVIVIDVGFMNIYEPPSRP